MPNVSQLAFLAIALLLSVVGVTLLWLRQRRPQSTEFGIEQFSRGIQALASVQRTRERGPSV